MTHAVTLIVYLLHIGGGMIALAAGSIAAFAAKGGVLHRRAGTVFVVAMLVMAVFAIVLATLLPGQLINVFIGIFTLYLVGTAWLTVRRKGGEAGAAEMIAAFVGMCICAPFVVISLQLAAGLPMLFKSAVAFEGPVLIALYSFTSVLVIAAASDIIVVLRGGISGVPRIARHLWRMCLGLALAYGSGFTNGFARLLPGPYHVPLAFFLPQFGPVLLLMFWMIRVRSAGWVRRGSRIRPA